MKEELETFSGGRIHANRIFSLTSDQLFKATETLVVQGLRTHTTGYMIVTENVTDYVMLMLNYSLITFGKRIFN